MRGSSVLAALLGFVLVSYILECVFFDVPFLDVPRCKSVSSCARMSGSPDPAYARAVGASWYHTNEFLDDMDAVASICRLDLNVSKLSRMLRSVINSAGASLLLSAKYADTANATALSKLIYMSKDMERAGISCIPESKLHTVYNQVLDTLSSLSSGTPKNKLSELLQLVRKENARFERLGLGAAHALSFSLPLLGTKFGWRPLSLAAAKLLPSLAEQLGEHGLQINEYINRSVGRTYSVRRYFVPLLQAYEEAFSELEEDVERAWRGVERGAKDVWRKANELEHYRTSLSPKHLSLIAPKASLPSLYPAKGEDVPRNAILRSKELLYAARRAYLDFTVGRGAYLCRARDVLDAEERIEKLADELDAHLSALKSLHKSCYNFVRSYKARSTYVRQKLRAILPLLKGDFNYCPDALDLVLLDENYASDEAILRACERDALSYPDYACSGDLRERIDCCLSFLEKKRLELYSTPLYKSYLELLSAIEYLLPLVGTEEDYASYYALPREPKDLKELQKAVNDATKLYKRLKRRAEKVLAPSILFQGFVSSDSMSELNIMLSYGIPHVSLERVLELPFRVYAIRQLEGNLSVSRLDEDKLLLRGGGEAKVWMLAYPHEPERERLGENDGYMYVRIAHEENFPLRVPLRGDVVSASELVRWDGSALYFLGPGEAIVREYVLSMEQEQDGNNVVIRVRNEALEPYTGTVFLPVETDKPPRGCVDVNGGLVCSIRLDPFEERVYSIEGKRLDVNVLFPPMEEDIPEFSPPEKEGYDKTRIHDLLSLLNAWYVRAVELNVHTFLSFDGNILSSLEEQVEDTDDPSVLSLLESLLERHVERTKRYVRALMSTLPPEAHALAEKALKNGDYMLALAIARSFSEEEEEGSIPILPLLLSALSIAILVFYLKTTGRLPLALLRMRRRKRRIPKL